MQEKTEPGPMPTAKQADDTPIGPHGLDLHMEEEYDAWLEFMKEFYHVTGHPGEELANDVTGPYNDFFIKLRTWGEKLALLRRPQPRVLELDENGYVSRRAV